MRTHDEPCLLKTLEMRRMDLASPVDRVVLLKPVIYVGREGQR